jgi:hypothetical protein
MVKEEYPVILKKLEDQLDKKAKANEPQVGDDGRKVYKVADNGIVEGPWLTRGLCFFGHPGSGESFAQRFDRC